ncbi:MAG: hypothetical protein R3324_19150, partial [Halobacteriales archaeon]|nr:hypothetical protein [Halobacteriales archaeon]
MIRVVDVEAGAVVDSIAVGVSPHQVAFTPDGSTAFVAAGTRLIVIDVASASVTDDLDLYESGEFDPELMRLAVSPDGSAVFIPDWNNDLVRVLDVATRSVVAKIPVGKAPADIEFSPVGNTAFVPHYGRTEGGAQFEGPPGITVVDGATRTATATLEAGSSPRWVSFNPTGTEAYVANEDSVV